MNRAHTPSPASPQTRSQTDLAELRAIAQDGRNRPLLGGRHFLLFGGAIAIASLIHAGIATRVLDWPLMSISAAWFAAMFGAVLLARTLHRDGKPADTVGHRVEREVWRAGGLVLGAIAVAIFAFAYLAAQNGSADGWYLFVLMPPIIFGVYAIALAASSAAARADFLKPYTVLSVGFMVLTVMLSGTVWQFAATAAGAVIVSVLPGLALLRRERAGG